MKIIQGTDSTKPLAGPEHGRLEALEKIVKSILERIQSLDKRIEILESPKQRIAKATSSSPAVVGGGPIAAVKKHYGSPTMTLGDDVIEIPPLELNADAVKKGLLTKMWKYLNEERPPKAA